MILIKIWIPVPYWNLVDELKITVMAEKKKKIYPTVVPELRKEKKPQKKPLRVYSDTQIKSRVVELIEKHRMIYLNEVRALGPWTPAEFNSHFEGDANRDNKEWLFNELSKMKITIKSKLREKMENSEAPQLVLAMYKLASTDEERRLLSTSFMETDSSHKFEGPLKVAMYTGGDVPPIATSEHEVFEANKGDARLEEREP